MHINMFKVGVQGKERILSHIFTISGFFGVKITKIFFIERTYKNTIIGLPVLCRHTVMSSKLCLTHKHTQIPRPLG